MGRHLHLFKCKKIVNTLTPLIIFFLLSTPQLFAQGFSIIQRIDTLTATAYTGDKPQSKVWKYGNYWWAVIPVPAASGNPEGTYLFRLDGLTWTKLWKLDDLSNIKADVKSDGEVTHILLKHESESVPGSTGGKPEFQTAKLISIEFVAGSPPNYQLWSQRGTTVDIDLPTYAETATIDIDSQNKMWLATEGGGFSSKNIYVLWSAYPYNSWSSPIQLSTMVREDEICAITAFDGNKMGVLWSDQNQNDFRFRYRNDSDDEDDWQSVEIPASGTINGLGIADDHINFAVDSRDGTIYAAVKTSYAGASANGEIRIGLLVRDSGTWDLYDIVTIPDVGTRPIVLLNENENIVSVFYTESDGDTNDDILFKESPIATIDFSGPEMDLSDGPNNYNNVSSTKQSLGDDVVILYYDNGPNLWHGVKAYKPQILVENGAGLGFHLSGTDNEAITITKSSFLNNISTTITLEAWVKPESQNDQEIIYYLEPENPPLEGYALSLTSGGKVKIELPNLFTLESTNNYITGEWTHIAATYSATAGTVKLYINGEEDNTGSYNMSLGNGNSDDFVLGAGLGPGGGIDYDRVLNGSFDEIRVWNLVRTENEIRQNMCKKIDPDNLPSSLIGYWNFDNPMGSVIPDIAGGDNDGTQQGISGFSYEWSGAALGDESTFDYIGTGDSFSANLSHSDGDTLTAITSDGTGIQVYRVDASPMRQTISGVLPDESQPFDNISPYRYYGVKVIGPGNPTYDVVYHYLGHPGIDNDANLILAKRDNLFDNDWEDAVADLNTTQHTLSRAGLTGTEFALASTGNNPLPVELAYFTGKLVNDFIKLEWKTETEVSNYGFDVERSSDGILFDKIGFLEGHGNSNSPKLYSYSDLLNGFAGTVYYRLKQIDTDGAFSYSNTISVSVGIPTAYKLFQNYPNPFNPNTVIKFQLPEKSFVTLKVFNSIGEQVAVLMNEEKDAGYYEVNFNAESVSRRIASGVYFYSILSKGFFESKKMVLIK